MKEFLISSDNANQRIDKFLLKLLNEAPKGYVYKMLRKKNIKLNSGKALGNEILQPGDLINIYLSDETFNKFTSRKKVNLQAGGIDVVFEDENILVINKPAGILTHPGPAGYSETLLDRALNYLFQKGHYDISKESAFTPAFCNRLDMNTTGIVVCGKNLNALQQINRAVSDKSSVKRYCAIVKGEIWEKGILKNYYLKAEKENKAIILNDEKYSGVNSAESKVITEYEPVITKNGFTLTAIRLYTGRSHQIRAHMASIGYPVYGDKKYGGFFSGGPSRQLLHGESLCFRGLSGGLEYLNNNVFVAERPADFLSFQKKIFGEGVYL